MARSPRDRFITIYGRVAVMEALDDERVAVDKVLVARNAHGDTIESILATARARRVHVERTTAERVTRISRNGRHDQGVVADVTAPGVVEIDEWLSSLSPDAAAPVVVLDGLTNPANVGMIIRVVTAAGMSATVLPRFGAPDLGPLVVKASAGTVFRASVVRAQTTSEAIDALATAGFEIVGLRGGSSVPSLYGEHFAARVAFVLGNESDGVSPDVAGRVVRWVAIPMEGDVESLNVATAAAVVAYELARRRAAPSDRQEAGPPAGAGAPPVAPEGAGVAAAAAPEDGGACVR